MLRTRVFALLSATLLGATLSGCTGTEEGLSTLRLALLTEGGAALRSVDTSPTEGTSALSAPIALAEPLGPGRDLHTVNSGRTLLVTRRGGVEARDADLEGEPRPFAALPPTFTPCLTQSALNAARTRLLTLSECPNDAGQFLALYGADGALIWTATLRTFTPPVGADTLPTRLAVVGDVGIVARAALGGGSEVIRAAPRGSGDPERDRVAVVSDPLRTVPIRDLANFGASVYAASKRSVLGLCDTWRKALAPFGIPVTALVPGYVDTQRLRSLNGGDASHKPFLMAEDEAARRMLAAVDAGRPVCAFPWQMRVLVRLLNLLPRMPRLPDFQPPRRR